MTAQNIIQIVSKDGEYAANDVETFVTATGLDKANVDYIIVAIMGPQSSGKSTLLNVVFGTHFTEMDALSGRHQTTRGIWMARAPKTSSPVLVMDLEGSDGRERGEDDTSFERQSALFALAAADVMLINMWAKDIGRETGAGKPLLKTIFQVNLKLFTPAPQRKRTVLLFVFRDRTRTPLSRLVETWQEDLKRMWAAISKPPHYDDTTVEDFFDVQYSSLPNYEDREEDFRAESVLLRRRFTDAEEDTLVRISDDKLPAQALPLSMQKLWQIIREQKDLNLPAHKVMVANIRCAEIAADQLQAFLRDQAWLALTAEAAAGIVPKFGARATALLQSCLSGYDEEARYFEPSVRAGKRQELFASAYTAVADVRHAQLLTLRATSLQQFKADVATALHSDPLHFSTITARVELVSLAQFQEAAHDLDVEDSGWTSEEAYQLLADEIKAEVSNMERQKLAGVAEASEKHMGHVITGGAIQLLDSLPPDLWPRLQQLHTESCEEALATARSLLKGYQLQQQQWDALAQQLAAFARELVKRLVTEASHTVLSRMKDRFNELFSRTDEGLPRSWSPRVKVGAIAAEARKGAAEVLALLAFVRFGVKASVCNAIDTAIISLAQQLDRRPSRAGSLSVTAGEVQAARTGSAVDMLTVTEWPGVAKSAVLLSAAQCRGLWRQFFSDTNLIVQQALATQDANRAASNRMPPLWAIVAMIVLGWNEFFTLLRSPLWLLYGVVLFLFFKTVYEDLDVDVELQRGLLPGLLTIGSKLQPAIVSAAARTMQAFLQFAQRAPQRGSRADGQPSRTPTVARHSGEKAGVQPGGVQMAASSFASPNIQHASQGLQRDKNS